ncbi:Sam domain family protein [Mycena venus]|uniref:Sam domain family protein n=1 Tax=Mycena venus TaxID=2733690 RepID=A0A8H6Z4A8_9AGAR|nr:Sam domain family protein [Mycena venus]
MPNGSSSYSEFQGGAISSGGFETLTAHERVLTIASLSKRNSQFRARKAPPVIEVEANRWPSNENTPTEDAGFSHAKLNIDNFNDKKLMKPGKILSNSERRDNLLKFWEAMIACGMIPPGVSIGKSASSATDLRVDCQHDASIQYWLRSHRLHKYSDCFRGMSWDEMWDLGETDLKDRGVYTDGARGRLMKLLRIEKATRGLALSVHDTV